MKFIYRTFTLFDNHIEFHTIVRIDMMLTGLPVIAVFMQENSNEIGLKYSKSIFTNSLT